MGPDKLELFQGFSKLSRKERYERLIAMGALSADDVRHLAHGSLDPSLAETFIENVIGSFQLPLGVATNFVIDGKAHVIPMAVEETSIVAAASKTAKWIKEHGEIRTQVVGKYIIGQIQVGVLKSPAVFQGLILSHKKELIEAANRDVAYGLVARGGGVNDVVVRLLERPDGRQMGVVHVLVDARDAMGANIVNQVCEYLKRPIEEMTDETVTMCILSNLVDTKLTRAEVVMRGLDAELMDGLQEASMFGEIDSYRAATNNKGVLNGIDPILIATGNDWRAVEAGIHAFAAKSGSYKSITSWRRKGSELHGFFEAPLVVGIVGGVTQLHPTARLCLKMLEVESAEDLSRICAAVGLVQNLGALRALSTVGIIEGHMKLHIRNLTLGAGANEQEVPYVQRRLEEILAFKKRISLSQAVEVLKELRSKQPANANDY